MSNSDSFIEEVTEEVRRERLYVYLRRYGWIAVLAVLALVGGAAFSEYKKATATAAAEATGDALLNAMGEEDVAERAALIDQVTAEGPAAVVAALTKAAVQEDAGELDAATQTLNEIAQNADLPEIYTELAAFKAAMLKTDDTEARLVSLEALSQPGRPFRLLALEQLAYADVAGGDTDGAIETLKAIAEDAAVSRGLRERAQTMMVALGVPPETIAPE